MSEDNDFTAEALHEIEERCSKYPLVTVLDDLSIDVDIFNQSNGERVLASMDGDQARALLRKLLGLFDPDIGSLQKVLHRHGLAAHKLESLFPDPKYKLPDYPGGFYLQKDANSQWYFGRPVNGAQYFEKCTLQDLIDLGVKVSDIKSISANVTYRMAFVGELRDS